MKQTLKRNVGLVALTALVCVMCLLLVCFAVTEKNAAANAADAIQVSDTVSVGHITDTHYYAMRLGYVNKDPIDTDDVDYFYNWVMEKCTKMWLESSVAFDASMATFAKEMPDYVVLSGDCAQDGELLGHIDVANKLRRLQETVRNAPNGKPDFQVFVVMGNHDLYNPDTFRFDETGYRQTFYYTTRMEIAKIYAGLGYPNMTQAEADEFYAPLVAEGLMDGGFEYFKSDLSDKFDYAWEFVKEVDGKAKVFSFSGENAYAPEDVTMAKLLAADEVKTIDNREYFEYSGMCYSYDKFDNAIDLEMGTLTGIQARKDGKFTCISLDCIISNAEGGHILGGQIQEHTQEWLTANRDLAVSAEKNTTVIGIMHHSAIEHWSSEEEITTGFIVYNPIEIVDFLADYGMRYVYTGHQHANDKASAISAAGNQIIDMEGSANVSVGSQIKITTVQRGTYDGKYAERAVLDAYPNVKVDATELNNKVFKDDKYGYVARNNVAEFIDADGNITDYSRYSRRRIYDNIVDNYMAIFLKKDITKKLGDILSGLKPIKVSILEINFADYADDVVKLANNLIKGLNDKVLADYTYGGSTERYKAADMKVFGFLEELVKNAVAMDLSGEGDCVLDVFMDCYMRHCTGEDWDSYEAMIAEKPSYAKAFENLKSGKFIDDLFNALLDEKTGLMRIINGLSDTTFDLSEGLSKDFTTLVNRVVGLLNEEDSDLKLSLSEFNLGALAKSLGGIKLITDLIDNLGVQIDLVNMTIPENIKDIVAKYLTENFKQGLGEYAYIIISGFGIDGGHHDVLGQDHQVMKVYEYASEPVTYIAKEREEIISIENGKLPSMLTNNFGKDVGTTRNFTYYTDRRITDGAIQYTTDLVNHASVTTKPAKTQVIGTTKPLIDLGIWCQSGYIELARHTVELSGLQPDTTYAYRAGSVSKGYWSEWYTFTTGSANGAFEAFVYSDVQSSTASAYQRIVSIQKDVVSKSFKNGVSFMINPGDIVDNGRNLSQYRWLYDTDQSFHASYATVVTAGNHDNKYFSVDKASNLDYYGGISENAFVDEYNYLWTHYNYSIPEAQVSLTGFYYSFDYGKVHFSVLNTNDIETVKTENGSAKQLGKAQYNWLVADLAAASEADYRVVIMHKSLYSEGSHSYDNDVVGMRNQLTPLFNEKGVNLVLAGHDHVYNETFYIDENGKKVNTDANYKNEVGKKGTLYVTMGCMGEKFYNFVDNDGITTATGTELHKAGYLSDPTFGKLAYDGKKLYYYGYQYLRNFDENGESDGTIVSIKKPVNVGLIVGITVPCAVVVLAAAAALTVIFLKKKKNGGKPDATAEAPVETPEESAETTAEEAPAEGSEVTESTEAPEAPTTDDTEE